MRPRYLLFSLGAASAVPGRFKAIFYQAHSQTPTQIGFLIAIEIIIALPAALFFSQIADRARSRENVIYALQAISLIVFLSQLPALSSLHMLSQQISFSVLTCTAVLLGIFHGPLFAIVYGISIAHLRSRHGEDGSSQFGKERVWGSFSWGVHSFLLGALIDIPSIGMYPVYVLFVLLSLLFVAVVYSFQEKRLRIETHYLLHHDDDGKDVTYQDYAAIKTEQTDLEGKKIVQLDASAKDIMPNDGDGTEIVNNDTDQKTDGTQTGIASIIAVARAMICNGGYEDVLFIIIYFCLSIGMAVVENLLLLVLVNDLGATNTLCGSSVLIMTIFELPVYSAMPTLLKDYGLQKLMLVAAAAYVVRVVWYTIAPVAWAVLLVEPLHGVTFAIVDAASVEYAALRTLGGDEATAQSVFMAIRAAGLAVGTIMGGMIMDMFGAKVMYLSCAALITIASISYAIVIPLSNR